MRNVPLVAQPGLEVVEVVGERVPGHRRRPRDLIPPAEERDRHPEHDGDHEPRPPPPPRPPCGQRRPNGYRRDGHDSFSPAIAASTASRSTTPTTRPFS